MGERDYSIRAEPKISGETAPHTAAGELLSRLVAAAPASDPHLKRVLETLQSQTHTLAAERDRIRSERDALESRLSQGRAGRALIFAVLLVALAISASGLVYVVSYLGGTDGVIAQLQSDVARLTGRSETVRSVRLSDRSNADRLAPPPAPATAEPSVGLGEPPWMSVVETASAVRHLPEMQALVGEVSRLKSSADETAAAMSPITEQLRRLTGEFSAWRTAQEKYVDQLDRNTASLDAVTTRLDAIVRESGERAETLAGAAAEIGAVAKRVRELERKATAPGSRTPANSASVNQPALRKAEPKIREIYVTRANDTLLSISRKFGVSVNRLLDANGGTLDDASRLLAADQQVFIPE